MFMPASRALPTSTDSDPNDLTEVLRALVRDSTARRQPLRIVGADTKAFYGRPVEAEGLSIADHHGIIDYDPAELVITARAGTALSEIEARLAENDQFLAFEPLVFGLAGTLGGAVASDLCGARRPFGGAVRDSLLGVTVMDGKGDTLRFGGTVFKNVAGFDAFRLMAGSMGCLGILLDVSLRVAPRPAVEIGVTLEEPWAASKARLIALMRRPTPLSGAVHDGTRLHLRLSGAAAGVEALARELGGDAEAPGFWEVLRRRDLRPLFNGRLWRVSIPMTADTDAIEKFGKVTLRDWAGAEVWLVSDARSAYIRAAAEEAGGHATLFRGGLAHEEVFHPLKPAQLKVQQKIKRVFDPAGIFNPGRMYRDL
jgi:glycolate oxidase FAD binding subunit